MTDHHRKGINHLTHVQGRGLAHQQRRKMIRKRDQDRDVKAGIATERDLEKDTTEVEVTVKEEKDEAVEAIVAKEATKSLKRTRNQKKTKSVARNLSKERKSERCKRVSQRLECLLLFKQGMR
jgi:hypothetical protein